MILRMTGVIILSFMVWYILGGFYVLTQLMKANYGTAGIVCIVQFLFYLVCLLIHYYYTRG